MPDKPKMEPCKACGAMMIWALTDANKWQPFDAKPHRMFELRQDGHGRWCCFDRMVYMPHHATCPNASEFRKPKQAEMQLREEPRERADLT